jgi:hypothetical protein
MSKKEIRITPEEAARILKEETVIEVDTSQEMPLKVVQPYFFGLKVAPDDIRQDTPAGVVFYTLCMCYMNQGNVSEGQVADVMYGFAQSGIPRNVTLDGFRDLQKLNYMNANSPEGTYIFGDLQPELYYKWTQKFFELCARTKEEATEVAEVKVEDTTVNKLEDE